MIASESSKLKSIILINKSDLDTKKQIDKWKCLYEEVGYTVIVSSAIDKTGIKEIKELLMNKKSLLWGQSGVGKSSLLNVIFPQIELKIGDISNYSVKGKHTTVTSVMIPVGENTFAIDTPGVREIDPYGIQKADLGHYFPEFIEHLAGCKFSTCTHHHEPECAVKEAADNEKISIERYESYLRMLETVEEDLHF